MRKRTEQTGMIPGRATGAGVLLMLLLSSTGLGQAAKGKPAERGESPLQSVQSVDPPVGRPLPLRVLRQMRQGIDFSQQGLGKPQAAALNRAFQELDLTDDQKVRIRQSWVGFVGQVRRLNALRRAKAIVFDDALYSMDFDAADADKKAADLAATEGDLLRNQMKIMIDIRQALSPAQGARFKQILEEERLRARKAQQPNPNSL